MKLRIFIYLFIFLSDQHAFAANDRNGGPVGVVEAHSGFQTITASYGKTKNEKFSSAVNIAFDLSIFFMSAFSVNVGFKNAIDSSSNRALFNEGQIGGRYFLFNQNAPKSLENEYMVVNFDRRIRPYVGAIYSMGKAHLSDEGGGLEGSTEYSGYGVNGGVHLSFDSNFLLISQFEYESMSPTSNSPFDSYTASRIGFEIGVGYFL